MHRRNNIKYCLTRCGDFPPKTHIYHKITPERYLNPPAIYAAPYSPYRKDRYPLNIVKRVQRYGSVSLLVFVYLLTPLCDHLSAVGADLLDQQMTICSFELFAIKRAFSQVYRFLCFLCRYRSYTILFLNTVTIQYTANMFRQ